MELEALRTELLSHALPPTDQQRDAIFASELEYLLRAAPGSGKTWTACRRFIWRAASWPYPVGGIALLSFTNVAIREFQDAAARLGQSQLLRDPNYLGTFDAFVERFILGPFGHLLTGAKTRPALYRGPRPGDRKNSKLQCWIAIAPNKKMPVYAWDIVPAVEANQAVFRTSNGLGSKLLDASAAFTAVKELLKLGFYTHAQRAFWARKLLKERPHITARLALRFPEIIVDEAQDTNIWLLHLLSRVRGKGTRVTLVGDPDQCIYSFAMADANSLSELKEKWQIPEMPLDKSFRCNDPIATAVRSLGTNQAFTGRGDAGSPHRRPFIFRETSEDFSESIGAFRRLLGLAQIADQESAIICRGNDHLQSVRGQVNYANLEGKTKRLAESAFYRDCRRDYKQAFQGVEEVLRDLIWNDEEWARIDDAPDSALAERVRETVWKFVKSERGLPPVSMTGDLWVGTMKDRLAALIESLGAPPVPKLGQKIQRRGLEQQQLLLPLFEEQKLFPNIRHDTIHQVKGESIGAVLVIGSAKFWNSVITAIVGNENNEDRRLAYVAITRAKDLVLLSTPKTHFDKHIEQWKTWGFEPFV